MDDPSGWQSAVALRLLIVGAIGTRAVREICAEGSY
jgi:hypothetical protein